MGFIRIIGVVGASALASALLGAAGAAPAQAAPAAKAGWRIVDTPRLTTNDKLNATDASGWKNIWAVGQGDDQGGGTPLALRWDGNAWKRVSAPSGMTRLWDVSTSGATNTWFSGIGTHQVLRWNNGTWSGFSPEGKFVQAVGAAGTDEAWLAVKEQTSSGTELRHFDGARWATVPSPKFTNIAGFRANGADDVWAVGSHQDGGNGEPFAMHWNGTTWTSVPVPHYSKFGNPAGLSDIAVLGENDVYASGNINMEEATSEPILVHWNGTKWSKVSVPEMTGSHRVRGIVKDDQGGLMLLRAGKYVQHRSVDGSWTRQTLPSPAKKTPSAQAMTHVPGTSHTLIVGGTTPEPSDNLVYLDTK